LLKLKKKLVDKLKRWSGFYVLILPYRWENFGPIVKIMNNLSSR
jgi:hypothetical protein